MDLTVHIFEVFKEDSDLFSLAYLPDVILPGNNKYARLSKAQYAIESEI